MKNANTTNSDHKVVALDGPAGSGKSTVAGRLARRLNMIHADSGAMYRTLTLACMDRVGAGESPADFSERLDAANLDPTSLGVEVVMDSGDGSEARQSNRIDGRDVGDRIRTPEVTARIRYIADSVAFREVVNDLLRDFARQTDLVVDGRDIGTVVFPDTPFKFFLEASVEVRAERRRQDFLAQGKAADDIPLEQLQREIADRDEQDRRRPVGALRQADDAILIDTSSLDVDAVVHRVLSHLQIEF